MGNNVKDQISRIFDKTRQMVEFSEHQEWKNEAWDTFMIAFLKIVA